MTMTNERWEGMGMDTDTNRNTDGMPHECDDNS